MIGDGFHYKVKTTALRAAHRPARHPGVRLSGRSRAAAVGPSTVVRLAVRSAPADHSRTAACRFAKTFTASWPFG